MEIVLEFIRLKGFNSLTKVEKGIATRLYSERKENLELYWEEPIDENHSGFDHYRYERLAQREVEWQDASCEFKRTEKIIAPFCNRYIKKNRDKEGYDMEATLIRKRLYMGYFLFQEDVRRVNYRIGKVTGERLSKYEKNNRAFRTALKNCTEIRLSCNAGKIEQCSVHRKNRSSVKINDELELGLLFDAIKKSEISKEINLNASKITYTSNDVLVWDSFKKIIDTVLVNYSTQEAPVRDFANNIHYFYKYIMNVAPVPWNTNKAVKFIQELFGLKVEEKTIIAYIGRKG